MIFEALILLSCGAIVGSLITAWVARRILIAEREDAQVELKYALGKWSASKAEAARLKASLDGNPHYFPRPLSHK